VSPRDSINLPVGASLTSVPKLPARAHTDLLAPFADSHSAHNRIITLIILPGAILGLWYFGVLNTVMPGLPKSSYLQNLEREKAEAKDKAAKAGTAVPATPTNLPVAPAK